jgi:probable rRNA maturation factor
MIFVIIEPSLQLDKISIDLFSNLLSQSAQQVITFTGTDAHCEATIVLTTDDEIHMLNKQFLNHDRPTDVLAFPADETDPDTDQTYLGDVIISYESAHTQAKKNNHTVKEELQLLVVHGMLHLLGFNHSEEQEKATMWDLQAKILTGLGITTIKLKY